MKYLFVFYFAGFFLADAGVIKKYKLFLDTKDDGFQGRVTLTLSETSNGGPVILDNYSYNVTNCTYYGTKPPTTSTTQQPTTSTTQPPTTSTTQPPTTSTTQTPTTSTTQTPTTSTTQTPTTSTTQTPTTSTTQTPTTSATQPPTTSATQPPQDTTQAPQKQTCEIHGNEITFPVPRTGAEVFLEFEGQYEEDGLSKYETPDKDKLYVADMSAGNHKIIFPCRAEDKAEFEFDGDAEVMSNLENLREKDEKNEISLRNLTFIRGDIIKDTTSIPSFTYYHMKNSKKMGQKLKDIMERFTKLNAALKILFTPIRDEIEITSPDLIILSKTDLNPDDSGSDYSDIVKKLAGKLFQRRGEEKTFMDKVGPLFAQIKISGKPDLASSGFLKFYQVYALEEDGFNNSKSLNQLASSEGGSNAEHIVTYGKGISVLYALDSICKDDNFMKGLSNYIKDGKLKLGEAFEGCFTNKGEAEQFFEAWTDSPGYPVVHVLLNKGAEYHMNQERFSWSGSEDKNRRWIIPIDYKTKEGTEENTKLTATEANVTVTINSTYFILDHRNTGYYRVNYDAKIWEALISQLKSNHTEIDPASRTKLIDDVFSFPKSTREFGHGIPDYVTALKLSEYLTNETDPKALSAAFGALDFLDSALNSSYHGKFRDHMKGMLTEIYNKITKEDVLPSRLKDRFILWACKFGVEECIKNATSTFDKIPSNTTELSNQQRLAICSATRNDTKRWLESLAILNAAGLESAEYIRWLGCSRDKTILTLFISQYITKKDEQAFANAVSCAVDHNPDNVKVILDIIKTFEGAIIKAFKEDCLRKILRLTLRRLNSESAVTAKELAKNLDEKFRIEVNTACDYIQQWTDKKAKRFADYFLKKNGGSQVKPIALVLLAATLLPFANNIFHS